MLGGRDVVDLENDVGWFDVLGLKQVVVLHVQTLHQLTLGTELLQLLRLDGLRLQERVLVLYLLLLVRI